MTSKIPKFSYVEEEVKNIWNIYWLTFSIETKATNLYFIILKTGKLQKAKVFLIIPFR